MLKLLMGMMVTSATKPPFGETLAVMGLSAVSLIFCQAESSETKLSLDFEMDSISWWLALLSVWVVALSLMSSQALSKASASFQWFKATLAWLLTLLYLSFSASNFLFFFFCFESCLIPIFLIILGWGYQPERIRASVYLMFYTLLGSLPLFFVIILCGKAAGSWYMHFMATPWPISLIGFAALTVAFLVKLPIYSSHLWLLKAHVEAPVAGSMVLAGVLLKLGGYGILRAWPLWGKSTEVPGECAMVVGVWGALLVSLLCLRQVDIKLLIASSSVVHMGLCLAGLVSGTEWGLKGALIIMLGHGLCSSGLFFLANLIYERTNSRSLLVNKGLMSVAPSMGLWWFLMASGNMSAPPTVNLLSEIMLISATMMWAPWLCLGLAGVSFLSASYSLYLYSMSVHGQAPNGKACFSASHLSEHLIGLLHWAPTNLLIVLSCMFI